MERKRGGGLKRKVSLLLAMLLIVTGIPMDTVYAAEDNGKEIIFDENKDDVDVEAANAEDQNKEEEPLAESTEEEEDNTEVVEEETEEGGNEETQTPAEGEGTPVEPQEPVKETPAETEDETPAQEPVAEEENLEKGFYSLRGDANARTAISETLTVTHPGDDLCDGVSAVAEIDSDETSDSNASISWTDDSNDLEYTITGIDEADYVGYDIKVIFTNSSDSSEEELGYGLTASTGKITVDYDGTTGKNSSGNTVDNTSILKSGANGTISLSIQKKTFTVSVGADSINSSYVDVTLNGAQKSLTVKYGEQATISATVKLKDTVPEGSSIKINSVKFVDSNNPTTVYATLTDAKGDGNYTAETTITGGVKAATSGKIVVEVGIPVSVTMNVTGETYGVKDAAVLQIDKSSAFENVADNQKYQIGDKLKVNVNSAFTATVKVNGKNKTDIASTGYTLAEADLKNSKLEFTIDVDLALNPQSKAVVKFNDDAGFEAKVNNNIIASTSLQDGRASITISNKDHYEITSVTAVDADGEEFTSSPLTNNNNGTWTLTVPTLTSASEVVVVNVTVTTRKVNTLTVDNPDTNIKNITVKRSSSDSDLSGAGQNNNEYTIPEADTVTLEMELTSKDYELCAIDVTDAEGKTTSYLANKEILGGVTEENATKFSVTIPKLNGNSTITLRANLKDGYTINFVGDHYYAVTYDSNVEGNVHFSSIYSYKSDDVSNGVTLKLKPEDGYRFKDAPTASGITFTADNSGAVVVYTATIKEENFNATTNKLEIKAETEKIIDLTLDKTSLDNSTEVKVYQDSVKDDNLLNDSNNVYTVKAEGTVIVKIKIDANKSKKISKATLKIGDADAETIAVDGKERSYTVTLKDIGANATLTLTEEDDAAYMSGITFVSGRYTVTDKDSNNLTINKFEGEDIVKLLANGTTFSNGIQITPENGYTLKTIKFDNKTIFDVSTDSNSVAQDNSVTLTNITLVDNKQPKFEVVTEAGELKTDITVKFKFADDTYAYQLGSNSTYLDYAYFKPSEELSLAINGEEITADSFKNGVYTANVESGTDYLEFTVNGENVTPKVTFKNGVVADQNGNSFKIAAAALSSGTTITLDADVDTKEVKFVYNNNEVSVLPNINNQPLYKEFAVGDTEADKDGNIFKYMTFKMRTNEKLTISVKAKNVPADSDLLAAEITGIDSGDSFTTTLAGFDVTADSDKTITISSKALENTVLLENTTPVSKDESGNYLVDYKTDYVVKHYNGIQLSTVTKADLVVDGTVVKTIDAVDNTISLSLDAAYAGKTVALNLKKVETVDEKEVVTAVSSISLSVYKSLSAVSIEGVGEDNILTQTVDTEDDYALTFTEGASFENLSVVGNGCNASVYYNEETGTYFLLVQTYAEKASENAATIDIINKKDYTPLRSITVNTVAVKGLSDATPTVTPFNGTSSDLVVKLAASGVEAVKLAEGGIYYKVTVIPTTGEGTKPAESVHYVLKDGDSQSARLENVLGLTQDGDPINGVYNFDAKVQLVQLDNHALEGENPVDEAANRIDVSKESAVTSGFATKKPYYSSEVTLEQLQTVVYRGQADVELARASFGEKTSYIAGYAAILNAKGDVEFNSSENGGMDVEADGTVKLDYVGLEPGTYTLLVKSEVNTDGNGDNTAVPASASISFKVENGVYSAQIKNLPNTIFKADGKAVKVKATVELNGGDVKGLKNKKVTWAISKTAEHFDANGNPVVNEFLSSDKLYNMVTVKNGTVTIHKDYSVSSIKENNVFYVVAIPEGNPSEADWQKVELTKEAAALGELHFAVRTETTDKDGNKIVSYEALAETNNLTTITSDEANNGTLCLIAVKDGIVRTTYSESDLLDVSLSVKAPNTVSFKSTQTTNGVFRINSISKTAKNMKFVVSTMDGGKSSKTELLTVTYTDISNLKVRIENTTYAGTPYTFTGTTEDTLTVKIGTEQVVDGETKFVPFTGQANVKVSMKGGKLVKEPSVTSTNYVFKLTAAEAKLTIVNKDDKNKATNTTVCEIINKGFTKTAAPAVTASVKSLLSDSIEKQSITYTFKKDAAYKFVKIQFNADDLAKQMTNSVKKHNNNVLSHSDHIYNDISVAWNSKNELILPIADKSFTVDFAESYEIRQGTAKLAFTYGNYDVEGNFVPETKTASVSVKFAPLTKASYTAQEAYALSLKDTISTTLTGVEGKNTKAYYLDGEVYNSIVDGEENAFRTYFGVKDGELYLKDVATSEDATENAKALETLKAMVGKADKNLTGYVTYRINGVSGDNLAKVTVSLKDTLKAYTGSTQTLLTVSGIDTKLNITYNGEEVGAIQAESLTNAFTAKVAEGTKEVVLTSKTLTAGANAAKVAFIPESSYYATYGVEDAKASTEGATVEFTANAVSSASNIISIPNNSVKFDSFENNTYFANVPYTSNVANNVSFTVKDTETVKLNGVVYFTAKDGNIVVSINKNDLDNGKAEYGKTYDVTATASFGIANSDVDYTFKVTMPSETTVTSDVVKEIFTKIRKAVWNLPEDEKDVYGATVETGNQFPASIDFTEVDEYRLEAGDNVQNDKLKELYSKLVKEAVLSAAKAEITVGVDIVVVADVDSITLPDKGKTGTATVKLSFSGDAYTKHKNASEIDAAANDTISVKVNLPAVDADKMMGARLDVFNINNVIKTASNSITEAEILSAVRSILGSGDESYRILSTGDFELTKATESSAGSATVTVYAKNIYTGEKVGETTISLDITQLQSVGKAASDFKTKFADFITNAKQATMEDEILKLAQSVIENSDITVAYTTKPTFTTKTGADSTTNVADKVSFALEYKYKDSSKKLTSKVEYKDGNAVTLQKTDYTTGGFDAYNAVLNAVTGAETDGTLKVNKYLNSNEAESKAALLKAANDALGNAPYTVSYASDGWSYKAPTYNKDGKVTYILEFKALSGATPITKKIEIKNLTVPKDDEYQTLDEAVKAVEDAFKAVGTNGKYSYTDLNSNSITAANVKIAVASAVKASGATRKLELAYKKGINDTFSKYDNVFKVVEPTYSTDGKVTLTFVITEQKNDGKGNWTTVDYKELTLEKDIVRKEQTGAVLKSDIKTALIGFDFSNTTSTKIIAKVRNVMDTTKYSSPKFKAGSSFKYENGTVSGVITITKLDGTGTVEFDLVEDMK